MICTEIAYSSKEKITWKHRKKHAGRKRVYILRLKSIWLFIGVKKK